MYEHEKHDNDDALQKAISLCQENGISPEEARKIKIDMLFKMAEKGDAFAQRCIGEEFLFNNQDPEKAFFWLNLAAEQGDDKAMVDIASGYSSLLNEEPKRMFGENPAEEFKWNLKAAELGNALGMWRVSNAYKNGSGVEKNEDEEFKWAKRALEAGNVDAYINIADIHSNPSSKYYDMDKAIDAYKAAMELGSIITVGKASSELGFIYGSSYIFNKPENAYSNRKLGAYYLYIAWKTGFDMFKDYYYKTGYIPPEEELYYWDADVLHYLERK